MSNPYQSPDQPATPAKKNRKKAGMMDVITGQKLLIYSIIGYLCALPFLAIANAFLGGTTEEPVITTMFVVVLLLGLLILLAAGIAAAVGILRMGVVLFPSSRFLYAIGVLIPAPLVGLIVMFTANASATNYLKDRGVKVGFFGAKR